MKADSIIRMIRPWLYNQDTILYSQSNSCPFHHYEEIIGELELIGVVTIREELLRDYKYVFSNSCPKPNSPFWNISKPSPPN